jgi:hypothetical protein
MQRTKKTTLRSRSDSPERSIAVGHHERDKHFKKNDSQTGIPGNDFLNATFQPLPATRCYPVFNKKNYNYLKMSAKNYSILLGSSFDFMGEEKDFAALFRCFENILPEGQKLSITQENHRLSFKTGFGDDFLLHEVFFIPVEILNRTEGTFRDILLCFFQHFQKTYRLPKKETMFDYEMIVENFEEFTDRDEEMQQWDFLNAYRNGYIHDTLELLYQKPNRSISELKKLIKSYKAKNSKEKQLIASIRQGIKIINRNKDIFSYACRPEYLIQDDDESCPVEAERMIRFTYSPDDPVSNSYLEFINSDSGEFGNEYFPCKSLVITPDTDKLLEAGFIECFFIWLSKFTNILYHYE